MDDLRDSARCEPKDEGATLSDLGRLPATAGSALDDRVAVRSMMETRLGAGASEGSGDWFRDGSMETAAIGFCWIDTRRTVVRSVRNCEATPSEADFRRTSLAVVSLGGTGGKSRGVSLVVTSQDAAAAELRRVVLEGPEEEPEDTEDARFRRRLGRRPRMRDEVIAVASFSRGIARVLAGPLSVGG